MSRNFWPPNPTVLGYTICAQIPCSSMSASARVDVVRRGVHVLDVPLEERRAGDLHAVGPDDAGRAGGRERLAVHRPRRDAIDVVHLRYPVLVALGGAGGPEVVGLGEVRVGVDDAEAVEPGVRHRAILAARRRGRSLRRRVPAPRPVAPWRVPPLAPLVSGTATRRTAAAPSARCGGRTCSPPAVPGRRAAAASAAGPPPATATTPTRSRRRSRRRAGSPSRA